MLTHKLIDLVGRNLGYPYTVINNGEVYYPFELKLKDKYTLDFRHDKKSDKIQIGCSFSTKPYENFSEHIPGEIKDRYKFKISVSPAKTGYEISNDIKKRLLPQYIKAFDIAYSRYQKELEEKQRRQLATKEIASLIGATPSQTETCMFTKNVTFSGRKDHIYVQATVEGEASSISLRHLYEEDLREIIEWLASKSK